LVLRTWRHNTEGEEMNSITSGYQKGVAVRVDYERGASNSLSGKL
jgi:hypothetical protein